jgi:hypothetical protein
LQRLLSVAVEGRAHGPGHAAVIQGVSFLGSSTAALWVLPTLPASNLARAIE